jgi:four helix bundle protein
MHRIESYRDLKVWQLGIQLAKVCYQFAKSFPKEELVGLTSQIRRSATSIPANIAEGNGRENTGDYIHFLRISQGSLKELETHLILSHEVQIAAEQTVQPVLQLTEELGRMIRALIRKLQEKARK